MPWGTFVISDSVSGQSFERTIDRDTTEVYVMPEVSLYWYGNLCGHTWTASGWKNNSSSANAGTLLTNAINLVGTSYQLLGTNELVKFSGFSSFHCLADNGNHFRVSGCISKDPSGEEIPTLRHPSLNTGTNFIEPNHFYTNISDEVSQAYVVARAVFSTCNVYAIWLE